MRPLRRRERQRRNLPCRASSAECCRERRESLSRPFHNFSIGRHLSFGPTRSPHQRGAVGQPVECCSDRATTFACHFLLAVFLATDPRRCTPVATVKSEQEFQEVVERGTLKKGSLKLGAGTRS